MKKTALSLVILAAVSLFISCEKEEHQKLPTYKEKKIVIQPGAEDGQDCLVAARETDNDYYATENHILNPDIAAIVWTYDQDNAGVGVNRTYIKFTALSEIPDSAEILSAKLSLYGVETGVAAPIGNSFYPGSPYEIYGENSCWLKRVTGEWSESTITWMNKPGTTDDDKASVPASTSQWNFDATDIDVTNMVSAMVKSGENHGFCLELKTEEYYRGIVFASSEHANEGKRPKLEVEYRVMQE